jgi:hypothetical protein
MYEAFSGETHAGIALAEGQDTIKDIPIQYWIRYPIGCLTASYLVWGQIFSVPPVWLFLNSEPVITR